MKQSSPALSAPPQKVRRRWALIDLAPGSGFHFRRRSFFVGWGGILITISMCVLVVALLVGWVLLWVNRPGGPSMTLLILGCLGFTLVLVVLGVFQQRLWAHWRLRQAEAAYLAGVSHNLRTPISAIRAAAQALQTQNIDPEQRKMLLLAIVYETRRLGLRVDNVLETGRLEVERQAFHEVPVNLSKLMDSKAEEIRGLVSSRKGTLVCNFEDGIWVTGDEHALRLVVDNLIDNALNYADGEPHLDLQLYEQKNFTLIRIADQGLGFNPADSEKLFKRFSRGETGRSGSGLGLSLAQAIARGHGGQIHLHSDGLGTGAIAEVWLPLSGEG
ncbi:MAG TPA: HAMP domain-containing histidine kinase [Myxococcales bacterium]|nr:HAMP domain-containing histidine kinase [Myxococcales bacterium]